MFPSSLFAFTFCLKGKDVRTHTQKGGLKMNTENALKQLGKVKYVVVTNLKKDISTVKLFIPSRIQMQIMDVLGIEYLKSEVWVNQPNNKNIYFSITMKYGDERKQKATTSSRLHTVAMFIQIVFTHVAQQ